MTPEHIQTVLISAIYSQLFGKSRDDLLTIARQDPNFGAAAGLLYPATDEDESMKDCFNLKALVALSKVEEKATEWLRLVMRPNMSEREAAEVLANIVMEACKSELKNGVIDPFAVEE